MGTLNTSPVRKAAATLLVVGGLSACSTTTFYVPAGEGREAGMVRVTGSFSDKGLARYVADYDPAMLALARRHDPRPHTDYWGRVEGWEVIDLKAIPRLGDREPDFEEARIINALRPAVPDGLEPAKPFVLTGSADARAKALKCLTQAADCPLCAEGDASICTAVSPKPLPVARYCTSTVKGEPWSTETLAARKL